MPRLQKQGLRKLSCGRTDRRTALGMPMLLSRYELLRAMSLEEMAALFAKNANCSMCAYNLDPNSCTPGNCAEGFEKWLKEKVEQI